MCGYLCCTMILNKAIFQKGTPYTQSPQHGNSAILVDWISMKHRRMLLSWLQYSVLASIAAVTNNLLAFKGFPDGPVVKTMLMQEMQVEFWVEKILEREMPTYPSIPVWKISWVEWSLGGWEPCGCKSGYHKAHTHKWLKTAQIYHLTLGGQKPEMGLTGWHCFMGLRKETIFTRF